MFLIVVMSLHATLLRLSMDLFSMVSASLDHPIPRQLNTQLAAHFHSPTFPICSHHFFFITVTDSLFTVISTAWHVEPGGSFAFIPFTPFLLPYPRINIVSTSQSMACHFYPYMMAAPWDVHPPPLILCNIYLTLLILFTSLGTLGLL
jgi:hypothetical protein